MNRPRDKLILLDSEHRLQILQQQSTNYADVTYDSMIYNIASATESNCKWCHCQFVILCRAYRRKWRCYRCKAQMLLTHIEADSQRDVNSNRSGDSPVSCYARAACQTDKEALLFLVRHYGTRCHWRQWPIAVTVSVLCALEDHSLLRSLPNAIIAPQWQFSLKLAVRT